MNDVGSWGIDPPPPSQAPPRGSVVPYVLAGLVMVSAALTGTAIVVLFNALGCGGDGGAPYAAAPSPRGRLCDSSSTSWLVFFQFIAAPSAVIYGVVQAAKRRSARQLLATAVIGFLIVLAPLVIFNSLPGECSEEQKAAGLPCEVF